MPPVKKIEIMLKILSTGGSGGSSLMDSKVVENLMDEDLGKI